MIRVRRWKSVRLRSSTPLIKQYKVVMGASGVCGSQRTFRERQQRATERF